MRHILSAKDFKKDEIAEIFKIAKNISAMAEPYSKQSPLKKKIIGTLFFEPSTRTRLSFESAVLRLGGQIISVESAMNNSSAKKGESLKDTLKTVSQYVDLIIVRHPGDKAIEDAVSYSDVPVISAGSGAEEHPTQALLDLFTIKNNFGDDLQPIDGSHLNIMFTGDLHYSRTIKSLIYLLQPYTVNIMVNVMRDDPIPLEINHLCNVSCYYDDDIYHQLPNIDILYMTRHQKERTEFERVKSRFKMTYQLAETMKKQAIIMHPLPRNDEIDPSTDKNPRAVYFSQVRYGLFIRMALLDWLLNNN